MTALFADAPLFPTSLGAVPGGPERLTRAAVDAAVTASVAFVAGGRAGSRAAA